MATFQYFVLFYLFVSIKEMRGSVKKASQTFGPNGKKSVLTIDCHGVGWWREMEEWDAPPGMCSDCPLLIVVI